MAPQNNINDNALYLPATRYIQKEYANFLVEL